MPRKKQTPDPFDEETTDVEPALESKQVTMPATCGWCGVKVKDMPEVFCSPECEAAKAARS